MKIFGWEIRTGWPVSRRLLGVERSACTFFQPFYAIFGRGIIFERIPGDIDKVSFVSTFF